MLKNLLLLSAFSTFVVIVIVGLDVYHKYTLSQLPDKTQRNITPINSKFDTKTLSELKKRVPVDVNLQEKSAVTSENSKETTLSPTPISTLQSITQASGASALQPPALSR